MSEQRMKTEVYKGRVVGVDLVILKANYATGHTFEAPSQRDFYISIDGEERSREAFGPTLITSADQAMQLAKAYIDIHGDEA